MCIIIPAKPRLKIVWNSKKKHRERPTINYDKKYLTHFLLLYALCRLFCPELCLGQVLLVLIMCKPKQSCKPFTVNGSKNTVQRVADLI